MEGHGGDQLKRVGVAIFASPGMGHLIPTIVFAARLASRRRFSLTLVAHSSDCPSDAERSLFASLPDSVNLVLYPMLPADALPDVKVEHRIYHTVKSNLPRLRGLLEGLAPLAALVVDPFCLDAIAVAAEVGVPSYVLFTSSCMVLSLSIHLHELDASFQGEYRDLPEPVRLPGCVPVQGKDLMKPIQDRSSPVYATFLSFAKRLLDAKGILVNSFEDLERGAIEALKRGTKSHPPIFPVGPLIRPGWTDSVEDFEQCLRWLDEQPPESVVYLAFGSGGVLASAQMKELALGLEMSQQRFLWVARSPLGLLPEGFLERTKAKGLVVPSWAPQAAVLSHAATGGFVTHCGWNSTLEALVHGVPLVAWPLYAEQRMNAVMLAEDVKVAMRLPDAGEGGVLGREEIARVIKCLMEGEQGMALRRRAREVGEAAARAVEEGGGSSMAMLEVEGQWLTR